MNIKNKNNNLPNVSFFNIDFSDKINKSTKLSNMYELITDAIIETKNKLYNFDFIIFIKAFPKGILQMRS